MVLTAPHSLQQNGVAERMNRTLIESARSMIAHAALPNLYWAEATSTATHIRNRMPTAAIKENKTLYERWYGKKPDVSRLRAFGCIVYADVRDKDRQKLDKKVKKMRFAGYSLTSNGYRLFDEMSRKLFIRRDVEFNENEFGHKEAITITDPIAEPKQAVEDVKQEAVTIEREADEEQASDEPRRPGRSRGVPVRYGYDEYAETANPSHRVYHVAYYVCETDEPSTIQEVITSNHAREWKTTAGSEYNSLIENET